MYHSIIIFEDKIVGNDVLDDTAEIVTHENLLAHLGDKNTWGDWYLIPSSRPVINPPSPKTKYVDIPGANGQLDLSTSLTGDIVYNNRQGSIEFIVDNGQLSDYTASIWSALYSEIMDYLHGKQLKIALEDDPYFYYEGRLTVNSWKSDVHNSKISIDYTVHPYKYEIDSSDGKWLWDTFSFEQGIIREYKNLIVDGSLTFTIIGRRMGVIPSFDVESKDGKGIDVKFKGSTYHLDDGDRQRIVNIKTVSGENTLVFSGNGTVSINYRGGCL